MKNNNDVVYINLDRPRELRYGHKALKQLVALTGLSLEQIEQANLDNLEVLEKIVYCGLLTDARKNNEALQLEDMEDLLDQAPNYTHIIKAVQEAFAVAFPQPSEGNEGKSEPAKVE